MKSLVVASTEVDAAALDAVRQHHAQLAGALDAQVDTLVALVDTHNAGEVGHCGDPIHLVRKTPHHGIVRVCR